MSTDLLFLNPEMTDGINVTVRRGRKWDAVVDRLPFPVSIKETGSDVTIARALVVGKMVVPFVELSYEDTENILAMEHSEECTDYEGLHEAMVDAYGEGFSEDDEVTVLFFRVTEECK